MNKPMALLVLAGSVALSVWGCKSREPEKTEDTRAIEIIVDQEELAEKEQSSFSFSDLRGLEFLFSSGAGGWQTTLTVRKDGSFSGIFFDGEMGDVGEGYPNGSMIQSEFHGRFTQPVQEDAFTYSVQIKELEYEDPVGTEEIRDGIRYCYDEAYGLDGTENIRIHLPGTPLEELSEEVRRWIGYYDLFQTSDTTLSFYVLENEQQGYGFAGYDMIKNLKYIISYIEDQVAVLETSIQKDPLSQTELTEKTGEQYRLWDEALNSTWEVLNNILDEGQMESLILEERNWIKEKEAAVAEAGAEYEGGSMQPMIMNAEAAQMTRTRVYELLELLE